MKKYFGLPVIISLAIFCSCQKQQTEEERKAEVERQVQERLAAERQAQSEQQLAQREADLEAREKALAAEKERAAESAPVAQALETPLRSSRTDISGNVATASYSTFYRKLEPYGVWRETPNYGYVWQPQETERSRSWRPYTNGRWVYTDAGWTWISEEPFGWATYHYGRWTRLRNIGWVWVPGDEWAPAWVSWRKGNDYVGWAPLPPEAHFDRRSGIRNWADNYYDIGPEQYCFVPTNEFGARRLETALVPVQRNVTIVNQTTNVTNITYSNTTIINQGPSYDDLRSRSRQPIERLRLERQITANVEAETPRSVIRGDVVQIPAPVIATAQPAERPRKIKETVAQTVVERGWEGIADRQAAEKARAKIKSEATPPPDAPPKTLVRPTRATAETSPLVSRPVASPPAPSQQTPSVPSPKISAAAATASPTVPSRRGRPLTTASPARELVPSPTVRPTPQLRQTPGAPPAITATPLHRATTPSHPHETPAVPPRPTLSPTHHLTPTVSSPSPAATEVPTTPSTKTTNLRSTSSPPVADRSAENKDQPKAEGELRKQEPEAQGRQSKSQSGKARTRGADASPGQNATAPPVTSPSPTESPEKEEKKKRKRERAGAQENE
ncbi:MAG TPA: DUF6600 domain-containing protein [Candidatus Baltobacteraceae bacterium]|nr:DUF6600 domain-containing protein [Candidatus Baltobacteraceae bacterium]